MMKTALLSIMAAALLSVGLVSSAAQAEQTPRPDPAPAANQRLTNETLATMLQNMGYSSKMEKIGNRTYHYVKMPFQGNDCTVTLQISANQEKIWLHIPLADLPRDNNIASQNLLKLLQLNDTIGPCAFLVNSSQQRLWMGRSFDNNHITPAVLRENLDRLMSCVAQTKSSWNIQNWAEGVK